MAQKLVFEASEDDAKMPATVSTDSGSGSGSGIGGQVRLSQS